MNQETPKVGDTTSVVSPLTPPEAVSPPQASDMAPAEAVSPAQACGEDKALEYLRQILSLKAEFENYRKRVDREKPEIFRFGKAELLLKLLPIYDLLLQAHRSVQASHIDTPLAKGMEGIFKEFEKIFKEEGVAALAPEGKPYDALLHEVLGTVESEAEEGTVIDVPQAGFTLNGKLLRSAKVRVARKASENNIEGGAS